MTTHVSAVGNRVGKKRVGRTSETRASLTVVDAIETAAGRGSLNTNSMDESTPLRDEVRAAKAASDVRRGKTLVIACLGVVALVGVGSTHFPTLGQGTTLEDGAYLMRGGWVPSRYGTKMMNQNFCNYNIGTAGNGQWGFACSQRCVASEGPSAANNAPKLVYLKNEGNFYTLTRLDETGAEFRCATDADDTLSRGPPGWRKTLIMCDVPKEAEGEEIFDGAKFTLATLADGKTSIYSQQRNKYCQDKGGKQECSFPGTISPHAKYEFVKVDDPANLYTSCQSAE